MPDIDYEGMGLRVGLEVHQQLATGRKLFCGCAPTESAEFAKKFSRVLRASRSEMGQYDPAAIFERSRSKTITYHSHPESSCLVEEDEEPPHDADPAAKGTALVIASALGSGIFSEIFPMRKIVIDGSNTSGFQRTMLVSQGGSIHADGMDVGVQSICLEEDAARLIRDGDGFREYGLDRLGIPLVEIALEPVRAGPKRMRRIALALGRLLRTTGRVARGLGTIRQDVNVSVEGGGVVEVKGVQRLDQLEKVVEFEAMRQDGLMRIASMMQERGAGKAAGGAVDITDDMGACGSKVIREALGAGRRILAIRFANAAGVFGFSPYEGVRLGAEIAQLAKSYGIGGVFHSDELPNYGIVQSDVQVIRDRLGMGGDDAFLMVALPPTKCGIISERIIERVARAPEGVPSETRLATRDGRTVFLRPRPGPSRMYPETDIPPIIISDADLRIAREGVPKPWDEMISNMMERYGLNAQLAEQVLDSEHAGIFEGVCADGRVRPNFAASILCSTITNLQRKGLDAGRLAGGEILRAFEMLAGGRIAKESMEMIFEGIMDGTADTAEEALEKMQMGQASGEEISAELDRIVAENRDLIERQGERAVGPLMGTAMKGLRGRASGQTISGLLAEKIKKMSDNNQE